MFAHADRSNTVRKDYFSVSTCCLSYRHNAITRHPIHSVSVIQAMSFIVHRESNLTKLVLLTYLGECRLFCPPYLKIFLHFDFGFLQQMLKVFDLSLEGSKASETLLVSNKGNRQCYPTNSIQDKRRVKLSLYLTMETGKVIPQTHYRTKAAVTSRFAHAQKLSLNFFLRFFVCNPCSILVSLWHIIISLVFFYLR